MRHRAEFTLLAMKTLGAEVEETIDWSSPRLVCVAGDFTKYDEHAVTQIGRNIELFRYRSYEGFFILELVNRTAGAVELPVGNGGGGKRKLPKQTYKTVSEYLAQANDDLRSLYELLDAFLLALGDDVTKKTLQLYFAYRRIKNFACVEVHPQSKQLLLYLKVDPKTDLVLEDGFTRDVSNIGHFGTGDLEVRIRTLGDLERAKPLVERSYDKS